ncbi:MAG: glycosyltransferase family 4 protein [Proteobacteria bacterium]|nr:glycosyltransferase family 4 protein [Pseudomonadota bacterium]
MKVILFSNDLMPFGNLPTSGGGLRCYQIMKGLESQGIEVIASMPGFTYLAEKFFKEIPEQQKEWLWRWETQDELLVKSQADAVIFSSNWDHYNLNRPFNIPLIIDLHGSRLIETTMWNAPVSTDKKVQILSKADCLLCAGERQRSYFYGWLVQAGRFPKKEHFIKYIPISLSPELPEHIYPDSTDTKMPYFVSGGGWFPWQNQAKAIFSICKAVSQKNKGTIQIFGTPHETSTISAEEMKIREIYSQVKKISEQTDRVEVKGYIGREDLIEIYRRANVAVEVMQYNLERELAFTTRTIEYLWCGLPVFYNNYAEISQHIKDFDAGWVVDPQSDTAIDSIVNEIIERPELLKQKSLNAQNLVKARFTWDKTIAPLVEFLNHPQKAEKSEPVLGNVHSRPSYLSPRGNTIDVPLGGECKKVSQDFIIPDTNICLIQVPLTTYHEQGYEKIQQIEFCVRTEDGKQMIHKVCSGASLSAQGSVFLKFPFWKRPKGGEKLRLEISIKTIQSSEKQHPALYLQGLLNSTYPFISSTERQYSGNSLMGDKIKVSAISLNFIPGGERLLRLKFLIQRSWQMVTSGQFKRFFSAVRYRLPQLFQSFR